MDQDEVAILDGLLEYAGKGNRTSDLFQEGNMLGKSKKLFSSLFSEVQNVLLQHKPIVNQLAEQALKGTLNPRLYPSAQQVAQIGACDRLILFIVGGATYEEA
jgi:hypothetical protein